MLKKVPLVFLIGLIVLTSSIDSKAREDMHMRITSTAFEHNAFIPVKFTCQGAGVNPPLLIEGVPEEAKSLVLVVDDPDAPGGDFVHWVVYDAPVISRIEENSVFGVQGLNSAGQAGYISPCPPSGKHRYFFKIYALDALLNLGAGANKADLEQAMDGHILDKAQLIGLYQKK